MNDTQQRPSNAILERHIELLESDLQELQRKIRKAEFYFWAVVFGSMLRELFF